MVTMKFTFTKSFCEYLKERKPKKFLKSKIKIEVSTYFFLEFVIFYLEKRPNLSIFVPNFGKFVSVL